MKLTIFNHKGGVGKMTLTVNIAAALAEIGKRVLVVDADPQCNLSSYLLDPDVLDDLLDQSDTENGSTLWSAVQPIVLGMGNIRHIDPVELPIEGAYLIPGDIRMSEFETELTDFWTQCIQRKSRGYMGTTALSALVEDVCKRTEIDIVFYDIGPNIGPLNRAVLLDCDAVIVPVACDMFSLRALKTLGRTLAKWIGEWKTICALAPTDVYLMDGHPRFLGYTPQQFRVYGGVPAKEPAELINEIDRAIRKEISSVLRVRPESS